MTGEKRLYRSRGALVGGVCAGVADYFDVDPVIVRILVIIFTIASGGLLGIGYVILWLVVPKEPKVVAPLEVEPQSVHSDTYGEVDAATARGRVEQGTPYGASPAEAASWRYASPYASAGHVPPTPPMSGPPPSPRPGPGPVPAPGTAVPQQPAAPPSYGGWMRPDAQPGGPCPVPEPRPPKETSGKAVKAALWFGSFLLFFGVVSMVATFVKGVSWWQYWPLIFVILGIVRMVVPAEPGHRMRHFVDGLVAFFAGVALLLMSLGVVGWQTLEFMLVNLWPVLLIMLGLLTLGSALKSPLLTLLAGLCFAAFCIVGLVWYSVPGATEQIVLSAPYGRDYYIYTHPWLG